MKRLGEDLYINVILLEGKQISGNKNSKVYTIK